MACSRKPTTGPSVKGVTHRGDAMSERVATGSRCLDIGCGGVLSACETWIGVTQERQRDQLALDLPCLRTSAVPGGGVG